MSPPLRCGAVLVLSLVVLLHSLTTSAAGKPSKAAPPPSSTIAAQDPAPGRPSSPGVATLLRSTPGDSLVAPLRRLEAARDRPREGPEAALTLGALHFARGEYRQAADAYARAAARLDPARKSEARYWVGLSFLALGEPAQARAALEEVAREAVPRRADAALGIAQAWEMSKRPERALQTLDDLLSGHAGEAGPAALERFAALSEALGRRDAARKSRERLLRDYPRSIEAASARLAELRAVEAPGSGSVAVVIGTFIDAARARSLASEARRAGFADATVVTRGQGLAAMHAVRLGTWRDRSDAKRAGEQAARALGVEYKLEAALR